MGSTRDPLLDYVMGATGNQTSGDTAPQGGADPTNNDPELRALKDALRTAEAALRQAQQDLKTATTKKATADPNDSTTYGETQGEIALAQAEIQSYSTAVHTLQQRIAQVQGDLVKNAGKPKPLTPQEELDLKLKGYAGQKQIDQQYAPGAQPFDPNNDPAIQRKIWEQQHPDAVKPYDPTNDPEWQRFLAERGVTQSDRDAATKLAQARFDFEQQQANTSNDFTRQKLGEDKRQFDVGAQNQRETQYQALTRALLGEVGGNERANQDATMKKYYDEQMAAIKAGETDAGNADRTLQKVKLALDYAKQYGLDSPYKAGYGAVAGFAGLAGKAIDAAPWKQEMLNPLRYAGISGDTLPNTDVHLNMPQAPTLPKLDTQAQYSQAQQMAGPAPTPFQQAQQMQPPAPMPQPTQPQPPAAQPAGPQQAGGDAQAEIAKWRQERIAQGQDPNDMEAWKNYVMTLHGLH